MPVPLLDLRAQYRRIRSEIDAAVAEVFESQMFVGGPKVEALERAAGAYLGAEHAVAVASGTDALLLSLKAVGVESGDEVITSTFSFFATAGATVNAGGVPVFVDVDPDTLNLDPAQVEARITGRTRGIVPVHLFGQCADMDPILALAARHGISVVEDAAQAIGARYKGRMATTLGDAAAISFYPTKNLGGAGDAGMAVARDAAVAGALRILRNHGSEKTYHHRVVGTNSRLDAIQAAVLLVKLKYIDAWNEARRAHAAYYDERFAEVGEVATPIARPECHHVYHQYVIRVPERDAACRFLAERGVGCAVFYPIPLHEQECFARFGPHAPCPVASQASREVLALPVYPELTREQQDEVVEAVKDHLAHR
ncbi:MAG TPA: DegT/DnrJ/EryC1/StrS family aminotransferase [Candidatus Hydrogenedentes bacterium]|nr:DegT/DnrJ/EryC1/StrS family aminotransferase [Candidatus Hydrogenedentota bacterium]HPG68437.1 DegT/DnrJ/EryC1/StrS family aminotransferase [Candidatus Hydrogenedentota bacterium]